MEEKELIDQLEQLANEAAPKTNSDEVQAIAACIYSTIGAIKAKQEMRFMIHVTNFSISERNRLTAHNN